MRRWIVVVCVALVVTGCGGGGGSASTKDDQNTANAAVLKGADLPSGFAEEASASSSSSSDSSPSQQADACFQQATGQDPKAFDNARTARAKSNFKKGTGLDTVGVEAEVEMLKDPKVITDQLAVFSKPEVADCLKTLFETAASNSSTATFSDVQITFASLDGIGDGGGTFNITGKVNASSASVPFAVEIDFAKVKRAALSLTVSAINGPPDHALAVNSLKVMAGRIS